MMLYGTDRLAIECLKMYDILMQNHHSERLRSWFEYQASLKIMLPYLAETGHRPYTKTKARCLDEIKNVDDKMLLNFKDGHFVVRRTDRSFAVVSLGLSIEQTLMASLKCIGGLSHCRTFSELNSLIWLMSRPEPLSWI